MVKLINILCGVGAFCLFAVLTSDGEGKGQILMAGLVLLMLAAIFAFCIWVFGGDSTSTPGQAGARVRATVISSWESHPMWWLAAFAIATLFAYSWLTYGSLTFAWMAIRAIVLIALLYFAHRVGVLGLLLRVPWWLALIAFMMLFWLGWKFLAW